MKNKILAILLFSVCLASFGFVSSAETDTLTVTANVLPTEISISVPESVTFQDITPGYISERIDLDIKNIGTTDVSITPRLSTEYIGEVFQKLGFRRVLSDELIYIRYFDFDIEKPEVVGGERSQNIYMYLDLEDFPDVDDALIDHTAEVIFTAVPL